MISRGWTIVALPLVAALFAQPKPPAPKPRKTYLEAAEISSPDRMPLALEHLLRDRMPEALVSGEHRVNARPDRLEVDANGDGNTDARVLAGKPKIVDFWQDGKKRPILVYVKQGAWYAAPGGCLHGTIEGRSVEFLDGDSDGEFTGPKDYVRWADGAFTRNTDSHLLAGDHELWTYVLRREDHRFAFEVTLEPRPGWASDVHWSTLMAVNGFRRRIGLPPMRLDLARCGGCQKHAQYLAAHPECYFSPTDGAGPHDEKPDNPEFSDEGQRAARAASITCQPDPAAAVATDTRTMLNRTQYFCSAAEGLGVGRVEASENPPRSGFTVIWTGWETIADSGGPIVVPGPGQRGTPTTCVAEVPGAENPPEFYAVPRGHPVSVTFGELRLGEPSIQLYADAGASPVRGFCFTPAAPVTSSRPENAHSVFFVAAEPLISGHTYVAVFTALDGDREVRLVWGFTTA